jgi:hypothetical protein
MSNSQPNFFVVTFNVSLAITNHGLLMIYSFPLKWVEFQFFNICDFLPTNDEISHTQPYPIAMNGERLNLAHKFQRTSNQVVYTSSHGCICRIIMDCPNQNYSKIKCLCLWTFTTSYATNPFHNMWSSSIKGEWNLNQEDFKDQMCF